MAIVIQIGCDGAGGATSHRVHQLVLECAVASSQEHGDIAGTQVGNSQIGTLVAVEVGRHQRHGRRACPEPRLRLEGTVSIAQEYRDVGRVLVGGCQVDVTVAEIDRDQGHGNLPTE